jgi:hypothetical protein
MWKEYRAEPGQAMEFVLTYPAASTLTTGGLVITKTLPCGPCSELLAISGDEASRLPFRRQVQL